MQKVKVTIVLPSIAVTDSDDDTVREAVKYALRDILEGDDAGEEELDFTVEEVDEEYLE